MEKTSPQSAPEQKAKKPAQGKKHEYRLAAGLAILLAGMLLFTGYVMLTGGLAKPPPRPAASGANQANASGAAVSSGGTQPGSSGGSPSGASSGGSGGGAMAVGLDCKGRLANLRQAITGFGRPVQHLSELGRSDTRCPQGGTYVFAPETQAIACGTPGHEGY